MPFRQPQPRRSLARSGGALLLPLALANKFTADAYKTFDTRGQVDVTDGHKGGRAAGLDCFQHVQSFLCNNHTAKNMLLKHGKKGKALLMQAQHATSMEQLGFVKNSMTPKMREYVERVGTDDAPLCYIMPITDYADYAPTPPLCRKAMLA
eukprot:COSAG05_NODE_12_length_37297_cov_117.537072_13_plen_151_part_00